MIVDLKKYSRPSIDLLKMGFDYLEYEPSGHMRALGIYLNLLAPSIDHAQAKFKQVENDKLIKDRDEYEEDYLEHLKESADRDAEDIARYARSASLILI